MFKNVLINDDHDAILGSIAHVLKELSVETVEKSQYCDDAFLKLKKAALENTTYDLLITDLSFKPDHRTTDLASGEDLIQKIRQDFPNLPIIVYSMNYQLQKVRQLIKKHKVNAYVCKDRKGALELNDAILAVSKHKLYLSPQVERAMAPKSQLEIDDFDINLLKLLSKGLSQEEISYNFKANDISPSGLSSIEKRLNKLRTQFKAKNAIHLVAVTKDLGLI